MSASREMATSPPERRSPAPGQLPRPARLWSSLLTLCCSLRCRELSLPGANTSSWCPCPRKLGFSVRSLRPPVCMRTFDYLHFHLPAAPQFERFECVQDLLRLRADVDFHRCGEEAAFNDGCYTGDGDVTVTLPSPLDSILEAVLTVSPNRQYLGIFSPTTPATHGPVCIPILSRSCVLGLCLILKSRTCASSASDTLAISLACRFPFLTGRPDTTMYASPIVSTWKQCNDHPDSQTEIIEVRASLARRPNY